MTNPAVPDMPVELSRRVQLLRVAGACAAVAVLGAVLKFALAPDAMMAGLAIAMAAGGFVVAHGAGDTPAERMARVRAMTVLIPLSVPVGVVIGRVASGPFHMDEWGVWVEALKAFGPPSVMLTAAFVAGFAFGHRRALSVRQA